MSSNNPYGGPQPPMSGQGSGSGPGQPLSPYGYPQQPSPSSPPAGTGYAFGPFAPEEQTAEWQEVPAPGPYGSPPGSYGAGPIQPTPQPKGKSKGRILIIIGAAALAVILMAVVAVVVATRAGSAANPGGNTGTQGQQTNPSQGNAPQGAARPSDAVAGYLQALATGDAVAALSYAADPAPTGPLLTNEVLVESGERAALTEVQVPVVEDQDATSVSATYTLGDSAVSESFDVVKVADAWKLSRAVKDLDISFLVGGSVPVKINGVTVDQESVAVLPGSYAFTTGLPHVGYGSKNVVLVKSPYVEADTFSIQSKLTKSGEKAVISAAKKRYNTCLDANSLTPKNCPIRFKSDYSYKKSTINWEQVGRNPFRKAKVTLDGTQARIEIPLNLRLTASCTSQGGAGTCSGTLKGKAVAVVKVTSKPLEVTWL
jgi:GH24 family phage-related lysozyme (muramidase)